jgi:hypothetical protein
MEGRLPRAIDAIGAIPPPPLHSLLAGVDRVRRAALTAAAPWTRAVLVDRERRVAFAGAALIVAAFAASCALPLWMVALGPIVWGVPHIVADVRYLIMKQGYHRRPAVLLAIGGGAALAGLGYGVRGGLAAAGAALLFSRGTALRRGVAFGAIAGLFAIAHFAGPMADVAFAHLHNLVAVALWWAWRRRETKLHYLPLAFIGLGTAALLAGAADPILRATGGLTAPWTGLTLAQVAYSLSPTPVGAIATRLVLLYAFGQAVHYIVWLRLIPEESRRSRTPRSYQQTYRALRGDMGSWVLWLALLGTLVFIVWAAVESAGVARARYLNIAFFHGYLELAAAALLWSEARLPEGAPEPAR